MATLNIGPGNSGNKVVGETAEAIALVFGAAHEYHVEQDVIAKALDTLGKAAAVNVTLRGDTHVEGDQFFYGRELRGTAEKSQRHE